MNLSLCGFCCGVVFNPPCSSDVLVEVCTLFINFDLECEKASMYLPQNHHILIIYMVKLAGNDFIFWLILTA